MPCGLGAAVPFGSGEQAGAERYLSGTFVCEPTESLSSVVTRLRKQLLSYGICELTLRIFTARSRWLRMPAGSRLS